MKNLLRIKDVSNKTSIAKSTIWLWVKQEKFPQPFKVSPRVTVWDAQEIEDWIESRRKR